MNCVQVSFSISRDRDNGFGPPAGIRERGDSNMVLQQETGPEEHGTDDVEGDGVSASLFVCDLERLLQIIKTEKIVIIEPAAAPSANPIAAGNF